MYVEQYLGVFFRFLKFMQNIIAQSYNFKATFRDYFSGFGDALTMLLGNEASTSKDHTSVGDFIGFQKLKR